MKTSTSAFFASAALALAAALCSCSNARFYSGFKPSQAVGEMALLGPVSHQFYIDAKNNEDYSDSLSVISEDLLADLTVQLGMPVMDRFIMDEEQMDEAVNFMLYLDSNSYKTVGEVQIPSVLDSLLESQGYRYGLLMYSRGMTRDRANYVNSAVKQAAFGGVLSLVIAVATLCMVVPIYTPSEAQFSSSVYVALLDAVTDRVVFYSYADPQERNPLDEKHMRSQLTEVLRDYLKQKLVPGQTP